MADFAPCNGVIQKAKRAAKHMNQTLNAHTIIPRSFIHCRAKRAAKYMNSTVNAIQIFPLPSQTSRLVGECLKVDLHSVVV